jgi:hypothetical protein
MQALKAKAFSGVKSSKNNDFPYLFHSGFSLMIEIDKAFKFRYKVVQMPFI